jgi:uncharacterized membrane protein
MPEFWSAHDETQARSSPDAPGSQRNGMRTARDLSRALGWVSLGLGAAQLAAPQRLADLAGVAGDDRTRTIVRLLGLREIATGAGLIAGSHPAPWMWGRVGGDAIDLALLASAADDRGTNRKRLAGAAAITAGIATVDAICSAWLTTAPATYPSRQAEPARVATAITVRAPASRVYEALANAQNLPRFVKSFASIDVRTPRLIRWTATLPGGFSLEWEIEMTEEEPGERLAWQTREGSTFPAAGQITVRPAPADQGTEIRFTAALDPPGGELGTKIGDLFSGAIGTKIHNDLRRFKQLVELGEIVQSDASIAAGPHPAQPSAGTETA